jgi:heme/copper-type cytochrome/quinol oxidase subunit 3
MVIHLLFLWTLHSCFQELIEWYTAIRAARLTRLAIAYPSAELDEVCFAIATTTILISSSMIFGVNELHSAKTTCVLTTDGFSHAVWI